MEQSLEESILKRLIQLRNRVYRKFTIKIKNKAGNPLSDSRPCVTVEPYAPCPAFIFFTSSREISVISAISSNEYLPAASIRYTTVFARSKAA